MVSLQSLVGDIFQAFEGFRESVSLARRVRYFILNGGHAVLAID